MTRKWPGLGPSVFEIDFAVLFDQYKDYKDPAEVPQQPPTTNELSGEIDIANTEHHKHIVKARNEYYNNFKLRFESNIKSTVERFDSLRKEEIRFNNYWTQNLKEITMKHI